MTFSVYRLFGNFLFTIGLRSYTHGGEVLRRIKELLMTKDLKMLEYKTKIIHNNVVNENSIEI